MSNINRSRESSPRPAAKTCLFHICTYRLWRDFAITARSVRYAAYPLELWNLWRITGRLWDDVKCTNVSVVDLQLWEGAGQKSLPRSLPFSGAASVESIVASSTIKQLRYFAPSTLDGLRTVTAIGLLYKTWACFHFDSRVRCSTLGSSGNLP